MSRPKRKLAFPLMFAVSFVAACAGGGKAMPAATVVDNAPHGELVHLAWLTDGTMVVQGFDDNGREQTPLWRFTPGKGVGTRLDVRDPAPECRRVDYREPSALSDGRLGLLRDCSDPDITAPLHHHNSLIAVDLDHGSFEPLAPLGAVRRRQLIFGGPEQDFVSGQFDWRFDDKRTIVSVGGAICPTLVEVSPAGVSPLSVVISDDGTRRWDLATDLLRERTVERVEEGCVDLGRATNIAWSPTGDRLAFFASLDAIGVQGTDRVGKPGSIYIAETSLSNPKPVVDGLRFPSGLVWIDEQRLAFSAEYRGQRKGVWILDRRSGETTKIGDQGLADLSLSPDGKHLAGIVDGGNVEHPENRIVMIRLPS